MNLSFPDQRPKRIEVWQLRPGDILLTHSQDSTGRIVQRATGDTYSHASIYLGNNQVAEAGLDGVQKADLGVPDAGHVAVFRHQFPFDEDRVSALHAFVDEMIAAGAGYDDSALSRAWVLELRTRQEDYELNWQEKLEAHYAKSESDEPEELRTFVCSAFVATCYFKVGILGKSMSATLANPDILLPEDLGGDHFFYGHIVGYLTPDGYEVPESDPFYNRSRWT